MAPYQVNHLQTFKYLTELYMSASDSLLCPLIIM